MARFDHQVSLYKLLRSVLGAFFGVQTQEVWQEDAQRKSIMPLIVLGILCALLLVLMLSTIVYFVLLS